MGKVALGMLLVLGLALAQMQGWQYAVLTVAQVEKSWESLEAESVNTTFFALHRRVFGEEMVGGDSLQLFLDAAGRQGWELVSVNQSGNVTQFFFKRASAPPP